MTETNESRVALVTGANRGIGLAAAGTLARHGFKVVMTARDPHRGEAARQTLEDSGLGVELRLLDIVRDAEIRALARWLRTAHGRLDVLVNNAGIMTESRRAEDSHSADPLKVSPRVLLEHFNVNTLGAVRLIQAVVPLMPDDGRIVNISSGMGQLAHMNGGYLAYRLSKTALNAATIVFANELRPRGIGVYAVCPGWVQTRMGGSRAPRSPREGADTIAWLATARPAPESGRFYRNRRVLEW